MLWLMLLLGLLQVVNAIAMLLLSETDGQKDDGMCRPRREMHWELK